MEDTRPNRRLSLGWALFFFWPAAFAPLLLAIPFLFYAMGSLTFVVVLALLGVLGLFAMLDVLVRLITRRPHDEPIYACPGCGADIQQTPHRCPSCGARLIWGHRPGPQDLRSLRQSFEH